MNSVVNKKLKILSEVLGLETSRLILRQLDSLMKRLMSKSIASGLLMKKQPWLSRLMIWQSTLILLHAILRSQLMFVFEYICPDCDIVGFFGNTLCDIAGSRIQFPRLCYLYLFSFLFSFSFFLSLCCQWFSLHSGVTMKQLSRHGSRMMLMT